MTTESRAQFEEHWRQIGSGFNFGITAVHFFNTEEGMIGFGPNVSYTTNGGQTWRAATVPTGFNGRIRDFYFKDRWNGWLAFDNGKLADFVTPGVWKTTDGGVTWTGIPDSYKCNSVFVGSTGNLVYSTGKIAWIDEQRAMMSRAHQSDFRFLQNEFWRTTNGGQSWVSLDRKEESWGLYYQKTSNTFYCYPENSLPNQGKGLWKSSDFGTTWTYIDHSATIPNNSGEIVGFGESIYIQGSNGLYRSTDRGQSFQYVGGPGTGFDVRMSVPPSCTGGVIVAVAGGSVWMSTDGGDGGLETLEPIKLDYPQQISTSSCTSPTIVVPLKNDNCLDLTIKSVQFETNASRFQLQPHQWPVTLKPNQTDSIVMLFVAGKPPEQIQGRMRVKGTIMTLSGSYEYDRVFTIDGLTNYDSLGLVMNLDTVDWGVRTNCVGCDTTITLTNLACDTMIISEAGLDNNNFKTDEIELPLKLGPGESKRIAVTCDIGKRKAIQSTFTVIGKTGRFGVPDTVGIRLDAVAKVALPDLHLLSDTIEFGSIRICDPKDTLISLFNLGCDSFTVDLENSNITPFSIQLSSNAVMGSGEGRVVAMRFAPGSIGEFSKTVRFVAKRFGIELKKDIYLHGTANTGALPPALEELSLQLDTITVCQSLLDTITFLNQSCESLSVLQYDVIGGSSELTTSVDATVLKSDSSGAVIVRFDPLNEGLKTFSVHLRTRSGSAEFDTMITITAFVKAGERTISQSTNAIDLGDQSVCVTPGKDITLTNNGCDTLTITSADLSSNFLLMGVTLPMKFAPGESRSIVVLGLVDTVGHKMTSTGTLSFMSNADNSIPSITLSRGYIYPRSIDLMLSMTTPTSGHNDERVSLSLASIGDLSDVSNIKFDLVYDADLLSDLTLSNGSTIQATREASGLTRARIELTNPLGPSLTTLDFVARLSVAGVTPISIENVRLNDVDPDFEKCVAAIGKSDASSFSYLYDCSEHSLQQFLASGKLPLRIISMRPNPVGDRLTLEIESRSAATIQIVDALGKLVIDGQVDRVAEIDTKGLGSGLYFVRISGEGSTLVRSLVKR